MLIKTFTEKIIKNEGYVVVVLDNSQSTKDRYFALNKSVIQPLIYMVLSMLWIIYAHPIRLRPTFDFNITHVIANDIMNATVEKRKG